PMHTDRDHVAPGVRHSGMACVHGFRAASLRSAPRNDEATGNPRMKLPAHGRYDYVPITRRPVYDWPEGKRLALSFVNNIEHFAFGTGLGSASTGAPAAQSQRNYAWRDYGTRGGLWYYLALLDEFGLA